MWSLPSSSQPQSVPVQPLPPLLPVQHPPPFLSSSPPPPPVQDQDQDTQLEDFSLPSDQFGFSEQEVFGTTKQKVKQAKKPQSIQDVLSLSKETKPKESQSILTTDCKDTENINTSPKPSPGLAPLSGQPVSPDSELTPSSPVSQSVEKTEPQVPPSDNQSSPYHEWLLILTQIDTLFDSVLNSFNDILNEDLKEAVISTKKGKSYLENFSLVFRVYRRILKSFRAKVSLEVTPPGVVRKINKLIDHIDLCWSSMEDHCSGYYPLTKLEEEETGEGVCGICLCGGASLVYNSSVYHPACANYWVNCVTDSLPSLASSLAS